MVNLVRALPAASKLISWGTRSITVESCRAPIIQAAEWPHDGGAPEADCPQMKRWAKKKKCPDA